MNADQPDAVPATPKCNCANPKIRVRGYAVYCELCNKEVVVTADSAEVLPHE